MEFVCTPMTPSSDGFYFEGIIAFSTKFKISEAEIQIWRRDTDYKYWVVIVENGWNREVKFPHWGLYQSRSYRNFSAALSDAEKICKEKKITYTISDRSLKMRAEEKTLKGRVKRFLSFFN